ncbi:MAG: helix-turn-helix transcriptional regulator [Alphaproteobacteria bacterium]
MIDEKVAAEFLGVTARTMQKWRQTGGGPVYVAYSSRCVRYRRAALKAWADARERASTSDPGQEAA